MVLKIFLLITAFILVSCTKTFNQNDFENLKFDIKLTENKEFTLVKKEAEQFYLFENQKEKLRLRIINVNSLEEGEKLFKEKDTQIQMTFAPQIAPYFASTSKKTTCVENIKLNNEIFDAQNEKSKIYNLNATEMLVYGSCLPEQEVFKSQLVYLFCKKNLMFYEIDYFYEKNKEYLTYKIVSCS